MKAGRAAVAIAAAVVIVAGGALAVRAVAGGVGGCDGGVTLDVAAAPEIAPAVREVAARFVATEPEVAGDCVRVQVRAAESADVANQLAARAGGSINVAATAVPSPADADVPTVWIPDASTWIARSQAVNREAFEAEVTPVASSPVVFAAADPAVLGADRVGAPQVATLLARKVQIAAVDPRRSTAALAGAGCCTTRSSPSLASSSTWSGRTARSPSRRTPPPCWRLPRSRSR